MYKRSIIFSLFISNLILACQKSAETLEPHSADTFHGATININSQPIAPSYSQEVQSTDVITLSVSNIESENKQFLSQLTEFQSNATCIEQDGKLLDPARGNLIQNSVRLPRFQSIEVFSLLPRWVQLKAKHTLKCRFRISAKNQVGSTLDWKTVELQINLPESKIISAGQLSAEHLRLDKNLQGQKRVICTKFEGQFDVSSENSSITIHRVSSEDLRVQYPIQECIFLSEDLENGILKASQRLLINFQVNPQVLITYGFSPEDIPKTSRDVHQFYFQMTIENQEAMPVTIDLQDLSSVKIAAEYFYTSPTEPNPILLEQVPERGFIIPIDLEVETDSPKFKTLSSGEKLEVQVYVKSMFGYHQKCGIQEGLTFLPENHRLSAIKLKTTTALPIYYSSAFEDETGQVVEMVRKSIIGYSTEFATAKMFYWDRGEFNKMPKWTRDNITLSCK